MEVSSKVAIVVRSYDKQGDNNIILSYSSFSDDIIFSHDVKCDEHLVNNSNMTFAQLAMIPIIREWKTERTANLSLTGSPLWICTASLPTSTI